LQPFPRRRVYPNIDDLAIVKSLSHEAAAYGREDRDYTGADHSVWVGILLVRMAEITWTLRAEARSVSRQGRELSSKRVRGVCLNVRDVDPVATQLVTQQSGLVWLGFLMIAAAMAGSSVFV
jgi:hypothetical protein